MLRGLQRIRGPFSGVAHFSTFKGNSSALNKLKMAFSAQNKTDFVAIVKNTSDFSEYELEEAAELAIGLGEITALQLLIKKLDNSLLHGQLLNKAICCNKSEVFLFLLQQVELTPQDKINAAVLATKHKSTEMTLEVLYAMEKDLTPPIKLHPEDMHEYARTLNFVLVKSGEHGLLPVLMFLISRSNLAQMLNSAYLGQALNISALNGFIDNVKYILAKCPNLDENFLIAASRNAKLRGHFKIATQIDDILAPAKMPVFISQYFKIGSPSYFKERDQVFRMLNDTYSRKNGVKKKH